MDGAIVCDRDAAKILRAGVHLMPDASIPTNEAGTRHRTADRVARQTGLPVISVSQSMHIIALYVGDARYVLENAGAILARANQALATLERYKHRLDEVSGTLSALEIEDLVTVRDVASVAQRLEMVLRIAKEIEDYVLELGTDGRLLSLQLDELVAGVQTDRELVIRDYLPSGKKVRSADETLAELEGLSSSDLLELSAIARALTLGGPELLDTAVSPRGYRLLAKVPRLPNTVVERLVEHFGHLQKLLAASIDDLQSRRRGGRHPGPVGPRGAVPARGVQHPRTLRLMAQGEDGVLAGVVLAGLAGALAGLGVVTRKRTLLGSPPMRAASAQ